MATAWTPIQWQSLSSAAPNITFSSIPGTYRDLRVVATTTGTSGTNVGIYVNGVSTGSAYTRVDMRGYGSSSYGSAAGPFNTIQLNYNTGQTAGEWSVVTFDLLDYSQTDKHKTFLIRGGHSGEVDAIAGRWASTAAITSVTIDSGSTFAIGSTFALYGIAG